MIWHNVDQNSEEWYDLRIGKITGSSFGKIMANEGKAFGEPAKEYALKLALERINGERLECGYTNAHMERGHEQEPLAKMLYEETFFDTVDPGGFFDCGKLGCSPDGLVGEDGMIEIKSVIAKVHYATVKRGGIDPSYKWQIYGNLMLSTRKWIDFVSYCAEYPKGKQLYVYRVFYKDCRNEFKRMGTRLTDFEKLIQHRIRKILL